MNNDYETLDEELENENLSEEVSEQSDVESEDLPENNINEPNIAKKPNNQYSSDPMKELAKSAAITAATAVGANAYNKFSRTNLGRNLITKGQNTLNALNQSNNPLAKLAANKANRMINPLKGIANNNPLSSASPGSSSPLSPKDGLTGNSPLGAKAQ